jgi:hypothetical protein
MAFKTMVAEQQIQELIFLDKRTKQPKAQKHNLSKMPFSVPPHPIKRPNGKGYPDKETC